MEHRTEREILTDRLLMLFLINQTERSGHRITGEVKLMKMVFQTETKMVRDKIKAFNYSFYRWDFGPLSNDVMKDLCCLTSNGLLEKHGTYFCMSSKGRELLKHFSNLFSRNQNVLTYVKKAVNEFAPYSGERLKEATYDSPILFENKLIRDTEPSEQLLTKLDQNEAMSWFLLDDDSEETLSLLIDQKACDALERGVADVRAGRVQKYKPQN